MQHEAVHTAPPLLWFRFDVSGIQFSFLGVDVEKNPEDPRLSIDQEQMPTRGANLPEAASWFGVEFLVTKSLNGEFERFNIPRPMVLLNHG
jgi:hypothetical protein